jgi:hypothetical protein
MGVGFVVIILIRFILYIIYIVPIVSPSAHLKQLPGVFSSVSYRYVKSI